MPIVVRIDGAIEVANEAELRMVLRVIREPQQGPAQTQTLSPQRVA